MKFNPASLEALARQFWTGTGLPDSFPRPIERAVSRRLPITIVKLPEVTVRHIEQYLMRRGLPGDLPKTADDLMGCLFAYRGHGIIFVCGADDPAEQRFTIGHDTAHFIVDYLIPRETIVHELGPEALEVLDGNRHPTTAERGMALLRQVQLGPHVHILPRRTRHECDSPKDGVFDNQVVQPAEDGADALGLELLAPRHAVFAMARQYSSDYPELAHQCDLLGAYFGLPPYVFDSLLRPRRPRNVPSFLEYAATKLGRQLSAWPRQGSARSFAAEQGGDDAT